MESSFAFVLIKGQSLIKIISTRNQDIIMVYEAMIKVDIYGVCLANTCSQLYYRVQKLTKSLFLSGLLTTTAYLQKITDPKLSKL